MTQPALKFVSRGARFEARYFVPTVAATESSDLLVTGREIAEGEPFVYPINYITMGTVDAKEFSYLETIDPDILDGIRSGRGLLMFDSSNEGGPAFPKLFKTLHGRLSSLGISPHKVVWVTQNTRFGEDYGRWADKSQVEARMSVEEYHCFLRQMSVFAQNTLMPTGRMAARRGAFECGEAPRGRDFICINFTPRAHRFATMLFFLKRGYLERGFVSFPGLRNRKLNMEGRADDLVSNMPFPDIDELIKLMPELEQLGPLTLDADPFSRISPVIDIGEDWQYQHSYLSIVTESGVESTTKTGERMQRFTEKPFKAVLGLHPFLIIGLPHTLQEIRRYGFRTFDPVIDETYDTIDDDLGRMTAVLAEIDRIMTLSVRDKIKLRTELHDVLLHNFDYFAGPLQTMFRDEIERPLFDRLRRRAMTVEPAGETAAQR